ncbi:endonuclease II [Aeromonas phage ZPAH1]|nr:endonuclease II [Aeromonas phage ZPAH1]
MKLEGFKKVAKMGLDKQGLLSREFLVPTFYQNVLYAFVYGNQVMYIGQAKDLWKRFDTYRNVVNWANPKQSNVEKNKIITDFISSGKNLWLYVRKVDDSMSLYWEERQLIESINPRWNIHFNKN